MIPSARSPSAQTFRSVVSAKACDLVELGAEPPVGRAGVGRDHHVARDVPDERPGGGLGDRGATGHQRLRVADAGGHPEHHRELPALGELEGGQGEVVGLLRVGGLEHGEAGRPGVVPVVLLVLRGGHARIVGRDHHQPGRHAGVGDREERVGGHVHAHVLHGDERAGAAEGGPDADLERHLLVGRPLGPSPEGVERLQDLGGGGAGVARAEPHPGVARGGRDRLVTGKKPAFHRSALLESPPTEQGVQGTPDPGYKAGPSERASYVSRP